MLKEIDYVPAKLIPTLVKDVSLYLKISEDKRFGILYDYLRLVSTLLKQMPRLSAGQQSALTKKVKEQEIVRQITSHLEQVEARGSL